MKDTNIAAIRTIDDRTTYPGFGPTLRAYRMGYHWHERMQAFVRVCAGESSDRFVIHVTPLESFMRQRGKIRGMHDHHFCWWDDAADIFALTDLCSVVNVKKPFIAVIADDGRIVRSERTP